MFPTVMLILNLSSVAVLWFGGHRVDDGADAGRRADRVPRLPDADPDVGDDGDVHAGHGAARRRCAPTASARCSTPQSSVPRRRRRSPCSERRAASSSSAASRSATPAPRSRCCATSRSPRAARAPPRRSSARPAPARPRWSTWSPGCSTRPAARCASTASTCATSTRRCSGARIGLVPQKAFLFSGTVASNLRTASRTRPRTRCGRRWRSPRRATSSRRCRSGLEAPIAQGGTNVSGGQRQRLAIARALVAAPGDLPVRRLVLRPRRGHRRAAARGARARSPPTRRWSSSRSGCRRSSTPTRSSCSRTARSSAAGTHDELLGDAARPTRRSSGPS